MVAALTRNIEDMMKQRRQSNKENGQKLKMWLKVGDEGGIWMAPSFPSWSSSHCHTEATGDMENSWGEPGFVSCVVGW